MASINPVVGPIVDLVDTIVSDPQARAAAKLALLEPAGARDLDRLHAQLSAILAEAQAADPWIARARPVFLYVMYALLLWSIPMGLVAAIRPAAAAAIARGMAAYLNGIPEPLYALFGTGYLGYTVARSWGKAKGAER